MHVAFVWSHCTPCALGDGDAHVLDALVRMTEENARLRAENTALAAELVPMRQDTERLKTALDRTTTELTLLTSAEKQLRTVVVERDALSARVDVRPCCDDLGVAAS